MTQGDKFENYVRSLYEALGYRVERNVREHGQQVDLVAVRPIPGFLPIRLLIECKWRTRGSVPNQEVINFIAYIKSLSEAESFTGYVLVTNTDFSLSSKDASDMHGRLELRLERDLEAELMNVTPALARYVLDYRDAPITHQYVHLSATNGGFAIENIEQHLLGKIKTQQRQFICVQGAYGAGKTTLLKKLKYELSQTFMHGESWLRPIFFQLKDFPDPADLDAFVAATMTRELWTNIPAGTFWKFASEGRLVLLLDGFDEIAAGSSQQSRLASFVNLSKLLFSGSTVILSCRPSYFVSEYEYAQILKQISTPSDDLPGIIKRLTVPEMHHRLSEHFNASSILPISESQISTLYLEPFSRDQILEVVSSYKEDLSRKLGRTPADVMAYLDNVYDLQDLMSRPILLDMIIQTLLLGAFDLDNRSTQVSAASLYDRYTSESLNSDWRKGAKRRLLTKPERREFSIAMALSMYDANALEVRYDDILKAISRAFPKNSTLSKKVKDNSLEVVAADLQICAFLTRTSDDLFRFVHKSFYEFFVAAHLFRRLFDGKIDRRFLHKIPQEILYFVGAFAIPDEGAKLLLRNTLETGLGRLHDHRVEPTSDESRAFRENIFSVMLFSGTVIGPVSISNVNISLTDVRRVLLASVNLSAVEFKSTSLSRVTFDNCILENTSLTNVNTEHLVVRNSKFDLSLHQFSGSNMALQKSTLTLCGPKYNVSDSEIAECSIVSPMGGNILRTIFARSSLRCEGINDLGHLEGCEFHECTLAALPTNGRGALKLRQCKFHNCPFVGVFVSMTDLKSCTFVNSIGFAVISDRQSGTKTGEEAANSSEYLKARKAEMEADLSIGEFNGLLLLKQAHMKAGSKAYDLARAKLESTGNRLCVEHFELASQAWPGDGNPINQ